MRVGSGDFFDESLNRSAISTSSPFASLPIASRDRSGTPSDRPYFPIISPAPLHLWLVPST